MNKPENHCTPLKLERKNQANKEVEREGGRQVSIELYGLATSHLVITKF